MNKKKLISKLLFLIMFTCLVSSLKIHHQQLSSLPIQQILRHVNHNLKYHNFYDPSQYDNDAQIHQNVFNRFQDFVANDSILTFHIHNDQPLPKVSAQKVKNYFLDSEQFQIFIINNLISSSQNPECLDDIENDLKDRLFRIILDQLDFRTIFLTDKPQKQFSQEQVNQIILQLKTDQQLGPLLDQCFGIQNNYQD